MQIESKVNAIKSDTMSQNPNNILDLVKKFSDEDTCRKYFETLRWQGKPKCGHCGSTEYYVLKDSKNYKCKNKECAKRFNVLTNSVFASSNIPLSKWFLAIYLASSRKKGVSSLQLAKDIGVTQKSAWFMLHRIRELFKDNAPQVLSNVVECDETYVGGKSKNKHYHKRTKNTQGRNMTDKTAVFGMMERGGKVRSQKIPNVKANTLKPLIYENIEPESTVVTDEWFAYRGLEAHYNHKTIDHGAYVWAIGDAHTNSMENYWSHVKRSIIGNYHSVSRKYMNKYCQEFDFRFNTKNISEGERFAFALQNSDGKTMPFKQLKATI